MAYSEELAQRMRARIGSLPGLQEKRMFGGVAFLLDGNMACGVIGDGMIVRVGPELGAQALQRPHARPFDMTGRPMVGWVLVEPPGVQNDRDLEEWLQQGVGFARSLPPK